MGYILHPRLTRLNLKASPPRTLSIWCGRCGRPLGASFLLGSFFKTEYGHQTAWSVVAGPTAACALFVSMHRSPLLTYSSNAASHCAFGTTFFRGLECTTSLLLHGRRALRSKDGGTVTFRFVSALPKPLPHWWCSSHGRFGSRETLESSATWRFHRWSSSTRSSMRCRFGFGGCQALEYCNAAGLSKTFSLS